MAKLDWDKARPVPPERTYSPHGPHTYWLTPYRHPARCLQCGNKDTVLAYRHSDQDTLCESCCERQGIAPVPSRRLQATLAAAAKPPKPSKRSRTRPRTSPSRAHLSWSARESTRTWATAGEFAIVEDAMGRRAA